MNKSVRVTLVALVVAGLALVGMAPASAEVSAAHPVTGSPYDAANFVELDGLLYLTGGPDSTVWTYDGTTFTPLPNSPLAAVDLVVFDGDLYVVALSTTLASTFVLYTLDGSTFPEVSPTIVSPRDFFEYDGVLYFSAEETFGNSRGWTLTGGTFQQIPGDYVNPFDFSALLGKVYFNADIDPTGGVANYVFSYDIGAYPTPAAEVANSPYSPALLVDVNGVGYVGGSNSFFRFDGTTFTEITDFAPLDRVDATAVLDGVLFFAGRDAFNVAAVYAYSGGVFTAIPGGARPGNDLFVFDGRIYFWADDHLASTDGGAAVTIPTEPTPEYVRDFVSYKGLLYFSAATQDELADGMWVISNPASPGLAATGVDVAPWLALALGLLLAGGVVVLRRRSVRA